MKRFLLTFFFIALMYCSAYGNTIINVPIDSRPISCEYLENLGKIGGDTVITTNKKNMDFFSSYEPDNHIGNSKEVRQEFKSLVRNNNNENTTVIINTSSYITNGLVGSRCAINYRDYKEALKELEEVASVYNKPKYYVNLPMPRVLPETRFNKIWADNEKVKGQAWYYINENPDTPYYKELQPYINVSPEQLLVEYGYVDNKALELGGYKYLTKWEKSFLNSFNSNYKTKSPYNAYVLDYKKTYESCADIFKILVDLKERGIIDEIVVSNDDLQLPNSINFFAGKNEGWIQREEGSPIKYSFARTYLKIAPSSISTIIKNKYGVEELALASSGRGRTINIINGTDEVPQLIYARDYSKRNNLTSNINITYNNVVENVANFDVKRAGSVLISAINFSRGNVGKYANKATDLYVYDYTSNKNSNIFVSNIHKSYSKGNNVALVELFGNISVEKGNYIFNRLLESGSLNKLSTYSAWNTNGNAIGLGIAQIQVYGVASQVNKNTRKMLEAQEEMLLQHFIEDGIYTSSVKRQLSNKGYRPNVEDRSHSQMLYDMLSCDKVVNSLVGKEYKIGDKTYKVENINIKKTSFPWGRIFDMYIDSQVSVGDVKYE